CRCTLLGSEASRDHERQALDCDSRLLSELEEESLALLGRLARSRVLHHGCVLICAWVIAHDQHAMSETSRGTDRQTSPESLYLSLPDSTQPARVYNRFR